MKRFREWMHGKGRPVMIAVILLAAFSIIFMYFQEERGGKLWTGEPQATATPKSLEDSIIGGDRLTAPEATDTQPEEDTQSGTDAPSEEDTQSGTDAPSEEDTQSETDVQPEASGTVCLGFAGDICLDDDCAVMRHMRKAGGLENVIDKRLIRKMNAYDAMIINNEFSISEQGSPMDGKQYTFRSSPENVKYLKQLGVDVAGLANNHVYDYGKTAFLDTLKYLKKADIAVVGAGKNAKQAKKPVYLTCKGKTIAIVAATRAEKYIMTPEAGKNSPGVFRTYDDTAYRKAIRKAKKKADFVVAYVHWGTEYSTELEDVQRQQAMDYIDAGADAVVGAHTHCMQGIGYYKGAPIFYSLGNFWFNEKTLYTTVLELSISEEGKLTAKMQPCIQKDKETKLLTGKKKIRKFVKYINGISTSGRLDKNCNVCKLVKRQ
ncbi:MAG: CapA family protein [Clostridiaceae bacterium]|nr:CapA family protein [Clostridiaceae bacterium]